jgi:MFS family permease
LTKIGRLVDVAPRRSSFLVGVFFTAFAILVFQITQTRILSVVAWYYLAFFAISVAMLGMTVGAVWVYLNRREFTPEQLSLAVSDAALMAAVAMPASLVVQFCLITKLLPTVASAVAWSLLMAAMTVPYIFAGIAVTLALTRSPFPVSQVYGVDLLGAAAGCVGTIAILNFLDGPSAVVLAGLLAAIGASFFARSASKNEAAALAARRFWRRPVFVSGALLALVLVNFASPFGLKPLMVKDAFESDWLTRMERWNSFSRIVLHQPVKGSPHLWGPSPLLDKSLTTLQAQLTIDGAAGTMMLHFDPADRSLEFLRYDLVNLAYNLPGIVRAAVIGVGGGRDLVSAYVYGVRDITGVELNRIFIDLHTKHPIYAPYSNLLALPGLKLHVDDARSWFAATRESFDLIQMSMIDTWAATGAGAFALSENGLYTLEGWRAFMNRLTENGVLTVSRWYNPGDINESGRMIVLALATMMDRGVAEPRNHVFVARADHIATLVLSKAPLTPDKIKVLRDETERLGFKVLAAPDMVPNSEVLRRILAANDVAGLDQAAGSAFLDLTVPTDNRPFFFNQLRFSDVPQALGRLLDGELAEGVMYGNLLASMTLALIFAIALVAVICTIVLPLAEAAKSAPRGLIIAGTLYFMLIGLGFMFAEISLLQLFSLFLGHPVYSLGVCLSSLILASGLGSLAAGAVPLADGWRIMVWGGALASYLVICQRGLPHLFEATTAQALPVRILISLVVVMPAGFLMGFAFPTGMLLVENVDREPTPWFWGINGATGVLASVLAVVIGMSFGINVTMFLAGLCYLALIPTASALLAMSPIGSRSA